MTNSTKPPARTRRGMGFRATAPVSLRLVPTGDADLMPTATPGRPQHQDAARASASTPQIPRLAFAASSPQSSDQRSSFGDHTGNCQTGKRQSPFFLIRGDYDPGVTRKDDESITGADTLAGRLDTVRRMRAPKGRRHLPQETLEELAGLGSGTVNGIVHGNRVDLPVSTLLRLCRALNVNPTWLMCGEGELIWDHEREKRGWQQEPLERAPKRTQVKSTPPAKRQSGRPSKVG